MKRLKNIQQKLISLVGIDRLLHFAFGGWLACLADTWYWAILIGLAVGVIKEVFDRFVKKSAFDYLDLLATVAGSSVTAISILLI